MEVQQKIELYRNCLNRCETDIHVNGQTMDQLKTLMTQDNSADGMLSYDTVDISAQVTQVQSVTVDRTTAPGLTLEVRASG